MPFPHFVSIDHQFVTTKNLVIIIKRAELARTSGQTPCVRAPAQTPAARVGGARLRHSPTLPFFPCPSTPVAPLPSMHGALATAASGLHYNMHNTLDLLLKHQDKNNCNIRTKQLKHSKHMSKTLANTHEKHLQTYV